MRHLDASPRAGLDFVEAVDRVLVRTVLGVEISDRRQTVDPLAKIHWPGGKMPLGAEIELSVYCPYAE